MTDHIRTVREILWCLLLITVLGLALSAIPTLRVIARNATTISANVERVTSSIAETTALVNDPDKGVLAELTGATVEARKAVREARKTIDVVQATSLNERTKVTAFSDASIAAVDQLTATVKHSGAVLDAATDTVRGLDRTNAALQDDATAVGKLLGTLDASSQGLLDRSTETVGSLNATILALAPTVKNTNETTGHIDGIARDAEAYVDNLVHPKRKSFWREWASALLGPAARVVIDHLWPLTVEVKK